MGSPVRVVIANLSAVYTGRGDTKLGHGIRSIIIKDDGAVSIHNDKGNKPLNYMGKGCQFTETVDAAGDRVWTFDSRDESLRITLHEVLHDTSFPLMQEDPGLVRDGTESHLQEWIASHPHSLGKGFTLVGREYPTGAGPVDILMRNPDGVPVAVEVKRVAMLGAVDQVSRYVEALRSVEGMENTLGMIAAVDVRPNTMKLAARRGIPWATIPAFWNQKDLDDATFQIQSRPELTVDLAPEELVKWHWLREDLVVLARTLKVGVSGSKDVLTTRIVEQLTVIQSSR